MPDTRKYNHPALKPDQLRGSHERMRRAEIVQLAAASLTGLMCDTTFDPDTQESYALIAVAIARQTQKAIDAAEGDGF